jgi:hypothetical protein
VPGKHGGDERAWPKRAGQAQQKQKKQDGIGCVKKDINEMKPSGIHAE